ARIIPIAQSGSDRRYFRILAGGASYIGTYVPNPREGRSFVKLAEGFRKAGRNVPEVFAVSDDFRFYLQEDLGEVTLFSQLGSPHATELIKKSLLSLISLQQTAEEIWKDECMARPFGKRQAMWDLNYFKYEYLKPKEVIFDEDLLEDDFERLAENLAGIDKEFQGFMMRDCQSRNVMVTPTGPFFIDFQGGRKGPALYDAVSFLWQARAGFDLDLRFEMLDFYCDGYCRHDQRKKEGMLASLGDMVLFRTLQVLGAYGFRGLVQRKAHFLLSIPGALSNLRELIEHGCLDNYPQLKRCAQDLTADPLITDEASIDGLTVEIYSFSYKKGYPEDLSGNGGGFMFDCRSLHNPGRYTQYRTLTGRNRAVIDFLESTGEAVGFLRHTWALTDAAVERYLARGFTKLQIGYGCTGGQHRSVYCAEQTAAHVKKTFPEVAVRLIHREHPE
ncbi:MAG: phosphotransferase, partial [Muribaculaceae bacterium]|nr:phosphotransferase [Muribaculaceae bacterium]